MQSFHLSFIIDWKGKGNKRMLKKVVDIAHEILAEGVDEQSVAVDFTCGGGHDSLFLSKYVSFVYSYDIQKEALDDAKKLCSQVSNIKFHHKSHLYFDEDVEHFDRGIFNLGYYPRGNRNIITNANEVLLTIKKAVEKLNHGGKIVIVCYPGFESGKLEAEQIEKELASFESKFYDIYRFGLLNRHLAPYIIGIEKH